MINLYQNYECKWFQGKQFPEWQITKFHWMKVLSLIKVPVEQTLQHITQL